MENKFKKILSFNGKNIYFLSKDGQYWIALKPICEALNVNWNRQFQNLKESKFLGSAFATQQMQLDGKQLRSYVCLPEKVIYGWLMSINSENPELINYQWKCYELLYNYFQGAMTERLNVLKVKSDEETKLDKLEKELKETKVYQAIQVARTNIAEAKRNLVKNDQKLMDSQTELNFN